MEECVCVYLLYTTYICTFVVYMLLLQKAKHELPVSSRARENSIIHHDPISWPFDCSAAHSHWLAGATDYSSQDTIFAGRKD